MLYTMRAFFFKNQVYDSLFYRILDNIQEALSMISSVLYINET